jgi:hypothetical protein
VDGGVTFYTAWGPTFQVFDALSKLFPNLKIQLLFASQNDFYAGRVIIQNGQPLEIYQPEDENSITALMRKVYGA